MEKQVLTLEAIKAVVILLGGIGVIIFSIRSGKRRIDDAAALKNKNNRHPYAKELSELRDGQTIIVIDFNDAGKPIAELVDEFSLQRPQHQRNFFVLQHVEPISLQEGKTYEVERVSNTEIVNLKEVTMLL